MNGPLKKPDAPLTWNAAAPELPQMPMISPGADAMSMTIAGVLPTLAAELTASVTALSVKENMYSGKLTAAETAYGNSDDQGSQSVGQVTSMLGDLGKMAQSRGRVRRRIGAGGGGGIFSSLMEQAMKMAESMGGSKDDALTIRMHRTRTSATPTSKGRVLKAWRVRLPPQGIAGAGVRRAGVRGQGSAATLRRRRDRLTVQPKLRRRFPPTGTPGRRPRGTNRHLLRRDPAKASVARDRLRSHSQSLRTGAATRTSRAICSATGRPT